MNVRTNELQDLNFKTQIKEEPEMKRKALFYLSGLSLTLFLAVLLTGLPASVEAQEQAPENSAVTATTTVTVNEDLAELELIGEVHPMNGVTIEHLDLIVGLDSVPHTLLLASQNLGAYCGGGTPAAVWKLTLDPIAGDVISVTQTSLPLIQSTRGKLLESSDDTLFLSSGWCGYRPPYYSTDGAETWQPANVGVHPPNSTFSFAEFNGDVYAGTGYHPYHGQIYRWLGDAGANYWELVLDVAPPRSIMNAPAVYKDRLFFGSLVYWPAGSGCESSVPVLVSADGDTYDATTGIPPCYSVRGLLVVGDQLVAQVFNFFDVNERYLYKWNDDLQEWEAIGVNPLGWENLFRPAMLAHDGIMYASGHAAGDASAGIYRSEDTGQTWEQIAVLQDPEIGVMTVYNDNLYIGTRPDANHIVYIYRMALTPPGSITIAKEANAAGDFDFGGDLGDFALTSGSSQAFTDLAPGSYTISETVPDYWVLQSVSCSNGLVLTAPNPSQVSIELQASEEVTCTFSNELTDTRPPFSRIIGMRRVRRNPNFIVRWRGHDPGNGSGIQCYDVQVKEWHGPWQDWQTCTTTRQAQFHGQCGNLYYFRSRATDNAGNVEDWPSKPDAWTYIRLRGCRQ